MLASIFLLVCLSACRLFASLTIGRADLEQSVTCHAFEGCLAAGAAFLNSGQLGARDLQRNGHQGIATLEQHRGLPDYLQKAAGRKQHLHPCPHQQTPPPLYHYSNNLVNLDPTGT
jgi:hypothetical protein